MIKFNQFVLIGDMFALNSNFLGLHIRVFTDPLQIGLTKIQRHSLSPVTSVAMQGGSAPEHPGIF